MKQTKKKITKKVVKKPTAKKPKIVQSKKVPVVKKVKVSKPVKVVKPVKVSKRPRKVNLVCILTGSTFKVSQAQLEKQALRLKLSVPDYIEYYVSKDARKSLKEGYTEAEIRNKHNYKDKTELPMRVLKCYAKRIKDRSRAKKRELRKSILENMESGSRYIVKPRSEPKYLDYDNPEHVRSLTTFSCIRPHVFLDNGRNCNGCNVYKHCICPIKKLK